MEGWDKPGNGMMGRVKGISNAPKHWVSWNIVLDDG